MSTLPSDENYISVEAAQALIILGHLAQQRPQQRLMQLVFNALDRCGLAKDKEGHPRDVFYVTDKQLLDALDAEIRA